MKNFLISTVFVCFYAYIISLFPGYSGLIQFPGVIVRCYIIILFVREGIPAKFLSFATSPTEWFFVELNLRKKKWLVCCSYNPDNSNIQTHLASLSTNFDIYSSQYDHFIALGDFNVEIDNKYMKDFCSSFNFKTLIRVPACYKKPR